MNDLHLTGSEARSLPLTLVLESFRPYIEKRVSGLKIPGEDREDLLQEAFVALLSAIGSYEDHKGSSFSTYAITCINNRLSDAVKAAYRKKNRVLNEAVSLTDESDSIEIVAYESPEEMAMHREKYEELMTRIRGELTDKERSVLLMWIDGYDYSEIGEHLGMSAKAVGNALQRARSKLKS